MKKKTLVRLKISIFTLVAWGMAWNTSMADVKWDSMGWKAQSCLLFGIIVLWGNTMAAFFDKSNAELEEETKRDKAALAAAPVKTVDNPAPEAKVLP